MPGTITKPAPTGVSAHIRLPSQPQTYPQILRTGHIIQEELNRRLEAARNADPLKQREECLRRDHARLAKGMDRLLMAYQEGLMSLEQLRGRMPELRRQDHAIQAELQSLEMAAGDQTKYLRLVETLGDFRARLRARANTLDIKERQKILRLLVKEVLVGKETITIRHSIRLPASGPDPNITPRPPHEPQRESTPPADSYYLLRSSSNYRALRTPFLGLAPLALLHHARLQPFLDQTDDPFISDPMSHKPDQPLMLESVEKRSDVQV